MLVFLYILLIIVSLISLTASFIVVNNFISLIRTWGVPYVPLSKKQLQSVVDNVKLNSTDKVVDLGCGDGRVLQAFEKQGVKELTGYEINLWAYLWGRIMNYRLKSKTKLYLKNFNQINLNQFDIIFCYLLEEAMEKLKNKFDQELRPGTKIISYGFKIPDWREPSQIIYTNKKRKELGRIFIYQK